MSALIIGPFLTTLPLSSNFTSPVFFSYFWNVLGNINYQHPGFFLTNPKANIVNSQLWTAPWELACYIGLAGLVLIGARRWPVIFPVAMILGAIYLTTGWHSPRGTRLLVAFFGGISLYFFRKSIPWNVGIFAAAVAIGLGAAYFKQNGILLICIIYMTVYLGLCNQRRVKTIRGADYSYGMYLYGYVIQQALYQLLPFARDWYTNAALSLIVTAAFAAFSWHLVEKPALRLRSQVMRLELEFLGRARRGKEHGR